MTEYRFNRPITAAIVLTSLVWVPLGVALIAAKDFWAERAELVDGLKKAAVWSIVEPAQAALASVKELPGKTVATAQEAGVETKSRFVEAGYYLGDMRYPLGNIKDELVEIGYNIREMGYSIRAAALAILTGRGF